MLASHILVKQYDRLEEQALVDDLHRLQSIIQDRLDNQARSVADYAHWDDSWNFMNTLSPEFRETNMTWPILKNLDIEHMIFLDSAKKLRSHMGIDIYSLTQDSIPLRPQLLQSIHWPDLWASQLVKQSQGWLTVSQGDAYLVTCAAVTKGENSFQGSGYLLFVRKLDSNVLASISTHLRIPVYLAVNQELPVDAKLLLESTPDKDQGMLFQGSSIVRNGKPTSIGHLKFGDGSIYFTIERTRSLELSGLASLRFFAISLGIAAVLLLGLLLWLFRRLVTSHLVTLERKFLQISSLGDLSVRVPVRGPKELRDHASSINGMLDALQTFQQKVALSEQEQRKLAVELNTTHAFVTKLIDFLPEATFAVDAKGDVVAWNLSMESLTKTQHEQFIGKRVEDVAQILYGGQRRLLLECFFDPNLAEDQFPEREVRSNGALWFEEFVANKESNQGRFLQQTAMGLHDSQGAFLGAVQMVRDVTDQKRAEMRLEFLSLHDPLTGLYNRTYYAEASAGWSVPSNLPLGVVMVDLDGLKLVNDTLGHEHGDGLILAAAGILKKVFSENPVARIGGDEFVVLFARSSEVSIRRQLDRLLNQIEEYNGNNPPLPVQMSVGFAWSDHEPSLVDLVKEADTRMYREKDLRRESVRAGYVANLQRRFEELHRKDDDAMVRLGHLVERFGSYLELSAEEMERLLLLAKFRDIGKVGINERIMNKPGTLETSEQEEMHKQPEIGYRIARLSRELSPIADLILKHREWWDGRGYPLGIAGEQIPKLNRALAVVETYVAMTSPRIRRRTASVETALEEIRSMAGKKLDPTMVNSFCEFLQQMQ